jgi:Fic family protein
MNDLLRTLREQKAARLKGNLYHRVQTAFAYNSNRIEGSTLTEKQTIHIFETNTLLVDDGVANVDDILETVNHFKLFDHMLDTVEKKLGETLVKQFHRILKTGTRDDREKEWFNVGGYKKLANTVGGMETSKPRMVRKDMRALLERYNAIAAPTLEDIVDFHVAFETIHPFQDGNGRVGRVVMFREALRHGVMPFIVDEKHKHYYCRGLVKHREGERDWLLDTFKSGQDAFAALCKKCLKK